MATRGRKDLKRATPTTLRHIILYIGLVAFVVFVYKVVAWKNKSDTEVEHRVHPALWHVGQSIPDYNRLRKAWRMAGNHVQCYVFRPRDYDSETAAVASSSVADGESTPVFHKSCPSYFQWIYQDLAPWRSTGIREEHLSASATMAAFRVVISKGRLYAEYYTRCFQSRGQFTLWGLLLLLDRYPGQVPDVDLMFHCWDVPNVRKAHHQDPALVPPLFSYCSTDNHWDIPFPDWSFWGWPETNIDPWDKLGPEIFKKSKEVPWEALENSAYWKGNPSVGGTLRKSLLHCNASEDPNSKAHLYIQNWKREVKSKFPTSNLAEKCNHRYNIYAAGNAWSVSYKYIMSCGAPVVAIASEYYEFFTRSLLPKVHYLPASRTNLCSSINSQVEWGNKHPSKAKEIGRRGQGFMEEELKLGNVYDYMLHLLQEYARLLVYVPAVPIHAEEVTKSSLLCVVGREMLLRNSDPRRGYAHRPCVMSASNPRNIIREIKPENSSTLVKRDVVKLLHGHVVAAPLLKGPVTP